MGDPLTDRPLPEQLEEPVHLVQAASSMRRSCPVARARSQPCTVSSSTARLRGAGTAQPEPKSAR